MATVETDFLIGALGVAGGAGVTLLTHFLIERFRQDRADRKDELTFRRQYHNDLVDLAADSRAAMSELSFMLTLGVQLSGDPTPADFSKNTWQGPTGLYRRLQRIVVGHPDANVQQAASDVSSALAAIVKITTAMHAYSFLNPHMKLRDMIDESDRLALRKEALRSINSLVSCIHGTDVERPALEASPADALYERMKNQLPLPIVRRPIDGAERADGADEAPE